MSKQKEFAFLFYVNDWAGGTQWMSRLQRGGYLDLLLYQVNNTSFSLDEIKGVLGTDFDEVWRGIKHKFTEKEGRFFNEKMKNVLTARKKFTDSRRVNRLGKSKEQVINTSETYEQHMEKEKEKEKEREKVTEKLEGGTGETKTIPTKEEFLSYCKDILKEKYQPLEFSITAKYDSWIDNKWKDGYGKSIKVWKTKIRNTIPHLKPMQNGTHKQDTVPSRYNAGEQDYTKTKF